MDLQRARCLSVCEPLPEKLAIATDVPRDEATDLRRFNALAFRLDGLLASQGVIADDIFGDTFFIPAEGHYPELAVTVRGYTSPRNSIGHHRGLTSFRARWQTYEGDDDVKQVGDIEHLVIDGIDPPTPVNELELAFWSLESTFSVLEVHGKRRARR